MNIQNKTNIKTKIKKKYFSQKKDFIMLGIGFVSILYLLNFSFGFVEFLPDALPLVGNLDEVAITGILISVLAYFDITIPHFFKRT